MKWTFTMDSERHLTLRCDGRIVFEGSYEAFVADGDVCPPDNVCNMIHGRAEEVEDERLALEGECADEN